MSEWIPNLAITVELVLIFAGLVLLWRLILSPNARVTRPVLALRAWEISLPVFFQFTLLIVGGSMATGLLVEFILKQDPVVGDAATVVKSVAAQAGMLVGLVAFRFLVERRTSLPSMALGLSFRSGVAVFLMSLPVLTAVSILWHSFLTAVGLPAEKQDLVGMFVNAESPLLLFTMITLAIVVAPMTEELLFRAGLFRYLRGRLPRWAAFLLPAVFFAALHVNWSTMAGLASFAPLVTLAVIFSIAYERTGHIGTAIVGHAFFNLNTVVLILCGVGL